MLEAKVFRTRCEDSGPGLCGAQPLRRTTSRLKWGAVTEVGPRGWELGPSELLFPRGQPRGRSRAGRAPRTWWWRWMEDLPLFPSGQQLLTPFMGQGKRKVEAWPLTPSSLRPLCRKPPGGPAPPFSAGWLLRAQRLAL